MTMYIQDIVDIQLKFYKSLTKINILLSGNPDATDGYKNAQGNVILYGLSGLTVQNGGQSVNSYNVLSADTETIVTDLNEYYDKYYDNFSFNYNGKPYTDKVVYTETLPVFNQLSKESYMELLTNKRAYVILSKQIIDPNNYQSFKNAMIGNILTNIKELAGDSNYDISFEFDSYWEKIAKPNFVNESNLSKQMLDQFEKKFLPNYFDYKPYEKGKVREFSYVRIGSNSVIENLILSLGYTKNIDNDKGYWNKSNVNPYITKVKLQ
jgi:hypothetical protein